MLPLTVQTWDPGVGENKHLFYPGQTEKVGFTKFNRKYCEQRTSNCRVEISLTVQTFPSARLSSFNIFIATDWKG